MIETGGDTQVRKHANVGYDRSSPPGPNGMTPKKRKQWLAPVILLVVLAAAGVGLAVWKMNARKNAEAAAASQPEPMESVAAAVAQSREHRANTISIGTVLALRSITLRNELPGTVRTASLVPGQIVEPGAVLVALDVSVEEAELKAKQAAAALAETSVGRIERAVQSRAMSQLELDRARAELDIAKAEIERIEAIIARKTIRAPFRARIGISDVHPGQYLVEGTLLTTLQGVDTAAHIDFTVAQHIGNQLREGQSVDIITTALAPAVRAKIIALDARVDPVTRNATVRARVDDGSKVPPPGASVRVRIPVGESVKAVTIPASALRKGPAGDHVFVIAPDKEGKPRAQLRWVKSGPALGDDVLIVSGLTAGDRVATSGSFKLREGVLVSIAEAPKSNREN